MYHPACLSVMNKSSGCSIYLPTFGIFSLFNFDHVCMYMHYLHEILMCIFLITKDVEHFILILVFNCEVAGSTHLLIFIELFFSCSCSYYLVVGNPYLIPNPEINSTWRMEWNIKVTKTFKTKLRKTFSQNTQTSLGTEKALST